jgi:hypothetical protein
MMYYQFSHFEHLGLSTIDQQSKPLLVLEWTNIVQDQGKENGFKTFVDQFTYIVYIVVHNECPPRIFLECK